MDPYKEFRFCSNCSTMGSLKYVSHKEGGAYVYRKCWDQVEEIKRRMKGKPVLQYKYIGYWGGCEG